MSLLVHKRKCRNDGCGLLGRLVFFLPENAGSGPSFLVSLCWLLIRYQWFLVLTNTITIQLYIHDPVRQRLHSVLLCYITAQFIRDFVQLALLYSQHSSSETSFNLLWYTSMDISATYHVACIQPSSGLPLPSWTLTFITAVIQSGSTYILTNYSQMPTITRFHWSTNTYQCAPLVTA